MVEFDSIKIKDQLGRPENKGISVKRPIDTIIVESNTAHIDKKTPGHSFILSHWKNSILGIPALGMDGSQIVLGDAGRTTTLQRVVSPGKIYREHFRDSYYSDTTKTTADWAVTLGQLDFTAGEVAESTAIAYNDGTVATATFNAEASTGDLTELTYKLSADGGSNWKTVTHATQHAFSNTGTDLRLRILGGGGVWPTAWGTWGSTLSAPVTLTLVQIEYG